jgi:hypothetical protein
VNDDVRIWDVTYLKHCPVIALGRLRKTVKNYFRIADIKAELWIRYPLRVAATPIC